MADPGGGFRGSLPTKYTHRRNKPTNKSIHLKRQMKAVQGISHSYSHQGSDFFFENVPNIGNVILFRFRVQEQTEYGQHQGPSGNSFISQSLLSNPGRLQVLSFIFACFY